METDSDQLPISQNQLVQGYVHRHEDQFLATYHTRVACWRGALIDFCGLIKANNGEMQGLQTTN